MDGSCFSVIGSSLGHFNYTKFPGIDHQLKSSSFQLKAIETEGIDWSSQTSNRTSVCQVSKKNA